MAALERGQHIFVAPCVTRRRARRETGHLPQRGNDPNLRGLKGCSSARVGRDIMRKSLHLAAASIIAMCAGSAFAAGGPGAEISGSAIPFNTPKSAKLLSNQNSNAAGNYVHSQN